MPRIDIYHLASFRARGAKWVLVGGGGFMKMMFACKLLHQN